MSRRSPALRLAGALGLFACVALCGCQGAGDITGAIAGNTTAALPTDEAGLHGYVDRWQSAYSAHPGEKYASINYARGLRALSRYKEAAAVMQQAAIKAPRDYQVLGEYGKALADNGDLQQARDVLSRSYPADRPNADFLSVQGAVADRLDDHLHAQQYYSDALKIKPDEPAFLSNLGLSYALSKNLDLADETLRRASTLPRADARVRQNFALVLALEGKFAEAETVSQRDMAPAEAAHNVEAIRNMIAQNESWRALQKGAPRRVGAQRQGANPQG
jgi:Flp pilus assembly protein TadD